MLHRRAPASDLVLDGLATCIFDSMTARSVLLDPGGAILAVNRAWDASADRHGIDIRLVGAGRNYLHICQAAVGPGSDGAGEMGAAIQATLDGRCDCFEQEYSYASGGAELWYRLQVTPLAHESARAIISHTDVTDELRPRIHSRRRLSQLTGRESEVLELVVHGYASAEIADELGISRNTAENHRQAILRKSGARNTADLVRLATLARFSSTLNRPGLEDAPADEAQTAAVRLRTSA